MSVSDLLPALPGTGPVPISPDIGVGIVFDPMPWVDVSKLCRYRMRVDRPALHLRAGETVLCAPYEPVELGMVVLVRCEADGYSPGALIPASDVEYLEPAGPSFGPFVWGTPGVRG